mgnify:CR=1 FL=1
MNFLFWNINQIEDTSINLNIAKLINETNSEFVVLAEYNQNGIDLLKELFNFGLDFSEIKQLGCQRISIFSNFHTFYLSHVYDEERYTIKELKMPNCDPLLVVLVHLISKLHANDDDQLVSALKLKEQIEFAEQNANHKNTIVIGDFNMNPFDKGMVSVVGMNSLPCLKTAKKSKARRKFQRKEYSFFYNPMWNLFGDFNGAPGTYFHSNPPSLSLYWNILDQVLIRPGIANNFENKSLKVVEKIGSSSLVDKRNRPLLSDHLPIFFSMTIPGSK